MDIQGAIDEISMIDKELLLLRQKVKRLNTRKKLLKEQIWKYMEEKNLPGLKYKGIQILPKEKNLRERLNDQEKIEKGLGFLKSRGISKNEQFMKEFIENLKGDTQTKGDIVFKK